MSDKDSCDLRIKRTRKLLCSALLNEMQVQPFNKITVNDICNRAMVHRATFYNHFISKDELLNYAFDDIQEELYEKTISTKRCTKNPIDLYIDLAKNVIDYLYTNRTKILNVMNNVTEKMYTKLLRTLENSFRYLLAKDKQTNLNLPTDVVVPFYTGGLTALAINCLITNKYTKEDLVEQFKIIVSGNIVSDQ